MMLILYIIVSLQIISDIPKVYGKSEKAKAFRSSLDEKAKNSRLRPSAKDYRKLHIMGSIAMVFLFAMLIFNHKN
jgi:hypothetical protein